MAKDYKKEWENAKKIAGARNRVKKIIRGREKARRILKESLSAHKSDAKEVGESRDKYKEVGFSKVLLEKGAEKGDLNLVHEAYEIFKSWRKKPTPYFYKKASEAIKRYVERGGSLDKNDPYYDYFKEVDKFLSEAGNPSRGLEGKIGLILSGAGLIVSLFFLSTIITGNAIGAMSNFGSRWIGIFLFVLSLIGIYFFKKNY